MASKSRYIAPIASLMALSTLAALPWGLPPAMQLFLPMLPVIAIYGWTLRRDAWLPDWGVFLAGLMLDVLTQGPLGYWSLIYLLSYVMALSGAPFQDVSLARRLVRFLIVLAALAVLAWLIASIYFLQILDFVPYAVGAAMVGCAALVIAPVFTVFDDDRKADSNPHFTRGA